MTIFTLPCYNRAKYLIFYTRYIYIVSVFSSEQHVNEILELLTTEQGIETLFNKFEQLGFCRFYLSSLNPFYPFYHLWSS